ncbi:hypothetical protein HRJ34_21635 [Rhizorhabdus wittichii]|uniref:Uncharacterized protein n=1 Tax=Rhizorhabdus wittichii TaxID=160791 RepID=A0A975HEJ6_9SPHN|nr:pilus assembly protein TadG-related protein [Rhizorhabdus wittichii]QTH20894.1 hypothetical protein HRJ34_21635 [Rhizorhabdus wittichii]
MVRAWMSSMAAHGAGLARATRGAVAVIGALSLTVLVGMGAFAVEISRGYAADTANQRIADMAALAGALAYNVNSNPSEMTATAKAVVVAQGLPASAATVALVTDSATSKQLVQVSVTTSVPIALGRVFSSALAYDVTATGSATTTATTTTAPPCIAALSSTPTYGITLSGGVSITSPGCAVNTNAGVTVPWGTTITAKQVNAGKGIDNPGKGITTSPTANDIVQNKASAATDWMKDDSTLKGLLCKVNQLSGYSDPDYADGNRSCTTPLVTPTTQTSASTEDYILNYSPAANVAPYWNSGTKTYTFPAKSYDLRDIVMSGGITAVFEGPLTLKARSVSMGGSGMTIGDGAVTVTGLFDFNNGSVVTIGNGDHSFGSLNVSGGRTLNVGSGGFMLGGGIVIAGGTTIRIGIGVGDAVTIGNASGTAINLGNGSTLCFTANCASPTAAGGTFSVNGLITTGGGSTLILPKAATHVINGNLSSSGAMTFGSGVYILNGNFTNGTGGAMTGTDVTFAMSGTYSLAGGTTLDLAAPGALASYGVPGILFATKTSSASTMGGGASGKYAGLIYAPKSDVTLTGGASMSGNGSNCLMMIVSTLNLSGGTNVASACSGLSGTSSSVANVALFK